MSASSETYELLHRLNQHGIALTFEEADTLRLAEITLHRWAEMECGDSDDYASWSIERDENTDVPYMCRYPHYDGQPTRNKIPDKEAGALKRVAKVCTTNGLHFYHQTDPRGCALYVSKEPIPDNDYTRGVCCSV